MATVFLDLALAFTAATLLPSAVDHLLRPRRFVALVREHGVVPSALASTVAGGVAIIELVIGLAAGGVFVGFVPTAVTPALLWTTTALGLLFLAYLRRLLTRPARAATEASCGCSPFIGRTTTAAYAPAAGLVLFAGLALVGLLAVGFDAAGSVSTGRTALDLVHLLPALWGLTLAVLASLIPATVPPQTRSDHRLEVTP
ncbi:MAG: MauE/DoxX family redox-associated membrane protein [Acidobacteriota bacterium]